MRILLSSLFIFLSYSSFPLAFAELAYKDGDFACISEAKVEQYQRDFRIDERSFGGRELCDSKVDTKKLFNDLQIIEGGEFEASSENVFIHGFIARDQYYNWAVGETRAVRRGHDVPYATAYNQGGRFTMQDGWAALSTLGRVGTFIHEARHTAGYRHTRCDQGPYKGARLSGCDTTLASGGSHGVEMEYYARVVVEGKNFHPVYKSMARLMALGRSNFVFNRHPIQTREALLLLDDQSELHMVDHEGMHQRIAPVPNGGKLKRTSFGASYYYGNHAKAIDLYSVEQGPESLKDDYSYFKLLNGSRDQIAGIKDLEELDINNQRFLVALNNRGSLFSYNYPEGAWHRGSENRNDVWRLVTTAPNGREGVFALMMDGSLLPYNPKTQKFGSPLRDEWEQSILSYLNWDNQLLSLDSEGVVRSGSDPYPELSDARFQQMLRVPLYDAFMVR